MKRLVLIPCAVLTLGGCQDATEPLAVETPATFHAEEAFVATFVVTVEDDADDGACTWRHCSLREAITAANASAGRDKIAFYIPGRGPHTI